MWRRVWIWERKLKSGKTYCLRWQDERGRVRTEAVGPDRKLAARMRAKREAALNTGRYRALRRIPFENLVREEEEVMAGRVADATLQQIRTSLDHFARICKPGALVDIDLPMVEQFYARRLKEVSEATANKDLRHVKASFNRAVERGYMAGNPTNKVKPVREPEKEIRMLSPEEVGKLMGACPSVWWQALVAVAVTTGMRRGELLALRWEDVDFNQETVWVRNTREHRTKSRKNRVLALRPEVADLLHTLPREGELVFGTEDGPMRGDTVTKEFRKIVEGADIKYCTLHDLRRTFVSHLANAGVNAALVQQLAGHSAIATTVKYYTRVLPGALRDAQSRLPFQEVIAGVSYPDRDHDEGADEAEDGKIIKLSAIRG